MNINIPSRKPILFLNTKKSYQVTKPIFLAIRLTGIAAIKIIQP